MKKKVIRKFLLFSILIIFLCSNVFAVAEDTCDIVARSACDNPETEGYVVMGLSSETNAHGELASEENYEKVLCCNIGDGDTTCTPTNKIIGLSAETNAHAEVPESFIYDPEEIGLNSICYENFVCEQKANCGTEETELLSLSSATNAHIGSQGDYDTKICCDISNGAEFGGCILESAIWNQEEVEEGTNVRLLVTGSGIDQCNGRSVSFEVEEGGLVSQGPAQTQPINVAFNGDEAIGEWVAEWVDDFSLIPPSVNPPEYIFTATLGSESIESSNELKVTEREDDFCIEPPITSCDDYENEDDCESDEDLCNVGDDAEIPGVNCDDENFYCGCKWYEEEGCLFGYTEITEDDCGEPGTGCNFGCTLCEDSVEGYYCHLGSSCPIGEIPGNNNGTCDFGIDGCSSEDCGDGDRDTCISPYYCNLGKCFSIEGPPDLGSCKVSQTIESDCEDEPVGYKKIRLTGTWEGETGGSAYEKCIAMDDEVLTIPCPAQIQLPFFGMWNVVIIVGAIILIYIIWKCKKKSAKRKVKKRKKKS